MINKMKINGELHDIEDANALHHGDLDAYSTSEEVRAMISEIELTPGEKGEKGDAFTYEDFTPEQLAALRGADGASGADGYTPVKGVDYFDGNDGMPGNDGASAYEIACANGFVGSEAEWLESLKAKGPNATYSVSGNVLVIEAMSGSTVSVEDGKLKL